METPPAADNTTATPTAPPQHPRAYEPGVFILCILLSLLGAIIGVHLITTLGISANTSVIGAVIAMMIGRASFAGLRKFKNPHRQNLLQTAISTATFAAANALLAPIAVPYALGQPELVWPMLLGCSIGVAVDVFVLFRAFGSRFMPASAPWPPGVASAETIRAGVLGGRRVFILLGGAVVGIGGSLLSLPMSAAGVALIGNLWALLMFAFGLLIAQYAPALWDINLSELYVAHGFMIGAGVVALLQVVWIIFKSRTASGKRSETARLDEVAKDETLGYTITDAALGRAISTGYILFVLGRVAKGFVAARMTPSGVCTVT